MPKDKDERKVGPKYRVMSQDLYSTGLHSDELGLRQVEVWRSKSRQFTKDSDIIGKIEEAKMDKDRKKLSHMEKSGFITLRSSIWSGEMDESSRRLVVKLFSDTGRWLATIEEIVAESYALSYATEDPMLSFVVLVDGIEIMTRIQEVQRSGIATETYGFLILGPEGTFEVFRIEGKRATLGDDFRVVRLNGGQTVAEIDSKFADIGGEFVVEVKDPVLAKNNWFCRVLQCFSVAIPYRKQMHDKIDRVLNVVDLERGY